MSDLHYVFKDDKVYAIREGKVVASADTLGDLEKRVANWGDLQRSEYEQPEPEGQYACPNCQKPAHDWGNGTCPHCGEQLVDNESHHHDPYGDDDHGPMDSDYDPNPGGHHSPWDMTASVVGPGGLKGKVLGKVRDVWGEEVAVRFENGRIAHLRVQQDGSLQGGFKESIEKTASAPAATGADLLARIEAHFDATRQGVTARLAEIESIRMEARERIASASPADASVFDSIMLTAEVERGTLRQALDAIEADEATQAELAPYEMKAAPAQESLGRGEGNWLDGVVSAMVAEAEGQDFDKIANEEPALFVSDLYPGALADTGVTRDMATSHIRSKTAGLARAQADGIERTFLANVEAARKAALSERRTTVHKQAAAREDKYKDLPDDILFS